MRKNFLLSFIFLFIGIGCLQARSPQFISMKTRCEFNLPQFDICLPLPPNTGFEVPRMMGDEIMFEIDEQTYYCFPLSYLENEKARAFRFAPTKDYKQSLILNIMPFEEEFTYEKVMQEERKNSYFVNEIPALHSKLGKSVSYLMQDDGYYNVYTYYYKGYIFVFRYSTMCAKEKQLEFNNLIKGIKPKNLYKEREKYENRVKYGYYDTESKKYADPTPDNLFQRLKGDINEATIFSIPKLDVSIEIPEGFRYEVDGRRIEATANKAIVELSEVDLVEQNLFFGMFLSDNFSVTYNVSTYKSGAKYIQQLKNMSAYAKQAKTVINGIEFQLLVYGTEELANVQAYAEVGEREYSIMIAGITIDNIEKAEKLLLSYNIDVDSKGKKETKKNPISSLIKMKKMKDVELDEVNLGEPNLENTFFCDITGVGLRLYYVGERKNYVTHIESPTKPIPANKKVADLPEDGQALGIFSMDGSQFTSSTIRKSDKKVSSIAEMIKSMKQGWAAYPAYKVLTASVVSSNGLDWGMFAYETEGRYLAMFITYINGYEVYYNVITNSESQMYEYSKLIKVAQPIK